MFILFFALKLYNIIFIFDYFFSARQMKFISSVRIAHIYVYDHKQGSIYSLPLYEPYFEVLLTIFISSEFCSFNKAFWSLSATTILSESLDMPIELGASWLPGLFPDFLFILQTILLKPCGSFKPTNWSSCKFRAAPFCPICMPEDAVSMFTFVNTLFTMQQSGPEAPAGSSMSQSVSLSKGIVFVVFPLSIQSHRQPVYVCVCGKKCSRTKKYIEKEGERTKYYLDTNTITKGERRSLSQKILKVKNDSPCADLQRNEFRLQ